MIYSFPVLCPLWRACLPARRSGSLSPSCCYQSLRTVRLSHHDSLVSPVSRRHSRDCSTDPWLEVVLKISNLLPNYLESSPFLQNCSSGLSTAGQPTQSLACP